MDSLLLNGLHHVSSLSAHIGQTRDSYTRVLGLRPVITTVNQDEPTMYHLFFTDGIGSPGSDMTVFDMRFAAPEYRGNQHLAHELSRPRRRHTQLLVAAPHRAWYGARPARTYPVADAPRFTVHAYAMGPGGPHAEVHVVVRDDVPRAKYGSGGVHHLALRVTDDEPMDAWVGGRRSKPSSRRFPHLLISWATRP